MAIRVGTSPDSIQARPTSNTSTGRADKEIPLPTYIANFDDARGWYHAYDAGTFTWRSWSDETTRPRLYYPASLQYRPGAEYFAVDGMGRRRKGKQLFECTINPTSGKFERLCVQTRDSFCQLKNSTWDRTIMRNSTPRMLHLAQFPFRGIYWSKRYSLDEWEASDWWSVFWRWLPATLGISILVSTSSSCQRS